MVYLGFSWGITLSLAVSWNPRHVEHFFTVFSMSAFTFIQYTRCLTGTLVFSIPMMLLCSCSSILGCSAINTVVLLPFIATLSIITISSTSVQCGCMSCFITFLFDSYPAIMYILRFCTCMTSCVAVCGSFVVMHFVMSVVTLMCWCYMIIPPISQCLHGQSAMHGLGACLHMMHLLYWWILIRTQCNCLDRVATPLFNI